MEKIINIFGDSIAWGAYDDNGGWADRLKQDLMKSETDYFEVYNLGISGDNTDDLLKRFKIENEARTSDVIMIAIGTNDASFVKSKNDNYVPLEKFENNLLEIIKQSKEFTGEIVFVGLTKSDELKVMPASWATDFSYDNKNTEIYNTKIKEICERSSLPFIEMLDLLDNDDLEDGLHPNSKGHEKMFLRVKSFLLENKIV
jgi:lysophospholipase L1-like esterase